MTEFRRVFGKRMLISALLTAMMNFFIFMLSCGSSGEIAAGADEFADYEASYEVFIEDTLNSSKKMSLIGAYDDFSAKSISAAAEDYGRLSGIKLTYGDNRAAVLVSGYHLTDLLLAAFVLLIASELLSERRKGLSGLIRSTFGGRLRLYFSRLGVLALASIGGAAVLYGGNVFAAYLAFGDIGADRAIQSVPEFMMCPFKLTIGEYFILSAFLKALGCFAVSVIFFQLIGLFGNAGGYIIGAFAAAAEIFMYIKITPVSAWKALRYVNLIALIMTDGAFKGCCYLNIAGEPVDHLKCSVIGCALACAASAAAGLIVFGRMYVRRDHLADIISDRAGRLTEKLRICRTLFGWESYKLLIRQHGGIILAAVFAAALSQSLKYDYFYPIDTYELEWYAKYDSDITGDMLADMEKEKAKLDDSVERYERSIEELLAQESFDTQTYGKLLNYLKEAKSRREALLPILENVRDGVGYTKRTGNTIRLIKPYSYELLLCGDERTAVRASLFIVIGIIGSVSGIYSFESRNRMDGTLRSSYHGRGRTSSCKLVLVMIISAVFCLLLHMIQLVRIGRELGFDSADAPIQSLMFMRGFAPEMTVMEYMILLFAARAAAACGIGLVCAAVSRKCTDTSVSAGISSFAAAASVIISESFPGMSFISVLYLVGGMGLMRL